ncbi:MAG: orotidine-5'-phosphate decarboxylase [Alphaproteobacteria bacterium]|nr:orotidine-5'-phosphate decarboxylase [Alphaproteobacteria bacterium]
MTQTAPIRRVFCALDTTDLAWAQRLGTDLAASIGGIKLGLEFYGAHGPEGVRRVAEASGAKIFLDMKLHDIPNTVAGAVRSLVASCRPYLLNVHASGGKAMLEAARDAAAEAAAKAGVERPRMLAVTVLTSIDDSDLEQVGQRGPALDQVKRLADLTHRAGLDGVVCSAEESAALRAAHGPDFLLVVPGIRPAAADDDQKRVVTPAEGIRRGASYLVIGRPITQAKDPRRAVEDIARQMEAA